MTNLIIHRYIPLQLHILLIICALYDEMLHFFYFRYIAT